MTPNIADSAYLTLCLLDRVHKILDSPHRLQVKSLVIYDSCSIVLVNESECISNNIFIYKMTFNIYMQMQLVSCWQMRLVLFAPKGKTVKNELSNKLEKSRCP